jgi:hypothetical protein
VKVNLFKNPEPIPIGEGDEAFKLIIRAPTDRDRMRCFDAAGLGMTELQETVTGLVIAWSGVTDEDGSPIPFERTDRDGRTVKNLAAFLAQVPLRTQFEVLGAIMGTIGLPVDHIERVVKMLPEPEGDKLVPKSPDGAPPDGATPVSASVS